MRRSRELECVGDAERKQLVGEQGREARDTGARERAGEVGPPRSRLESSDVPTAAIITREFVHEARTQCAALGMEGLEPVVIDHPLSTLTEGEIEGRIVAAVPGVKANWLGRAVD